MRGLNPRLFKSGLHDKTFYEGLWSRLIGGQSWHGVMVNRRKNGELYEEDVTIAPVHDADGELTAYVAVKHDLSVERRLQADLDRHVGDRDLVMGVMSRVRPAASLQATAMVLCEAVVDLTGVAGAMVLLAGADLRFVPLGLAGTGVPEWVVGNLVEAADPQGVMADLSAGASTLEIGRAHV